jgi:hypothetical protein
MPKVLPVTSLVVIVGLCVAVAIEARSISALSRRLRESEARAAAKEQVLQAEQAEVTHARESSEVFRSESEALRKQIAGGPAAPASATGAKDKNPAEGWGKAMSKMMSDPAMKKVMRQQQSMAAHMMYADLIKQLGLSAADGDKLMELLADRQMAMSEKGMSMMNGETDPAKLAADGKAANDSRADYDAKIKAMLGDDGFGQFQQYESSVGDRMIMQQYQQQFSAAGQPLEDSQREALLQIMSDERTKSPPSPFDPASRDVAGQIGALQSDQAMHDLLASQDDLNRRVLERAGQVLNPDQVTAFQKIQQQMSEMQQAGMKMARTMFQPSK